MAPPLRCRQMGLTLPQRPVRPRQLCGSFCNQALQIAMSTMKRLLGLPAHSDLALQLHVLPGKLLKHAVDCSCKGVKFVRSASGCDSPREIAFGDGRRSAADFLDLKKKCTTDHPSESSTQDQHNAHCACKPIPEASDQRLEADALAAHQEVVSARYLHMRTAPPNRGSISHAYPQPIGSRLVRDLGWPRRQIAGQPPFRRVCKDYDFVSGQSTYLRLHRRSESL